MEKKILIKAPKGFRVKYRSYSYNKKLGSVFCDLIDMSKPNVPTVGHVELAREGRGFVTHSSLNLEYQGRGLGNLLYSKAIAWALNHGYSVRSSGDSSFMAKRVWESKRLRILFNIRKENDTFYGYNRETWYATRKRAAIKTQKVKRNDF